MISIDQSEHHNILNIHPSKISKIEPEFGSIEVNDTNT